MNGTIGHVALVATGVAGLVAAITGRRVALAAATAAAATALGVLLWAFATNDYTLTYVADHGRRAASPAYRIVGTWAGMGGSLTLWNALIGVVGVVAAQRSTDTVRVFGGVLAAFTAVMLLAADPFERLGLPPLDGFGMNPILEHPAMIYHPPLLYVGLVASLPAFALALGGRTGWRERARRWTLVQLALLTAGLLAGAHWAYVELDWGGYWAWDPVENAGLLPWIAGLLALHALVHVGERAARLLAALPWTLVVLGTLLGRSGLSQSVHAFAEDALVGKLLLAVGIGTVALAVWSAARVRTAAPERTARPREAIAWAPLALLSLALLVVAVGTFVPLLTNDRRSIQGWFFARPLAVAALVALVAMSAVGRRPGRGGVVAHVGFGLMCLGFGFSTLTSHVVAPLPPGERVEVAGVELENRGVDVDGTTVTATLHDGDHEYRPQLVGYPEQGRIVAETSLRAGFRRDVLVALRNADDDGAVVVEVWVRPFTSLVWTGALLLIAGLVSARATSRSSSAARARPAGSATGSAAVVVAAPALPLVPARERAAPEPSSGPVAPADAASGAPSRTPG